MREESARVVGFGQALAEQVRWFWHRQWVWIVVVTVLTAGAAAWIIASIPEDGAFFAPMLVGSAFHPLLVLIALSWAFSAWRDDPPKDRQYFWLHPVGRASHTIARSLAAFLWLALVVAIVVATVYISTRVMHGTEALTPRLWLYLGAAIALAYFSSSVAPILSNRPGAWVVLVIAIVVLAGAIGTIREIEWLKDFASVFQGGPRSFGTALGSPGYEAARFIQANMPGPGQPFDSPQMERLGAAEPGTALLVWLPIALAAWVAAAFASRPR